MEERKAESVLKCFVILRSRLSTDLTVVGVLLSLVTEGPLGQVHGEVVLLQLPPGAVPAPAHRLAEDGAGQPGAQGGVGHHLLAPPRGQEEGEHHGPGFAQLVRHLGHVDLLPALGLAGSAEAGGRSEDPETAGSTTGLTPLMVVVEVAVRNHYG